MLSSGQSRFHHWLSRVLQLYHVPPRSQRGGWLSRLTGAPCLVSVPTSASRGLSRAGEPGRREAWSRFDLTYPGSSTPSVVIQPLPRGREPPHHPTQVRAAGQKQHTPNKLFSKVPRPWSPPIPDWMPSVHILSASGFRKLSYPNRRSSSWYLSTEPGRNKRTIKTSWIQST